MMAARFRSVTWVAIALVPALGCYLVTQRVAAERAELARVDRQIGLTRRAIRDLETELGTRGSMAQLERWNTQTLALVAPTAQQFITGDVHLASLTALPSLPRPAAPAGAAPASAAPTGVRQAAFGASTPPAAAETPAAPQPLLRQATYVKPPRDQAAAPTRVAMLSEGPLDAGALADIGRLASAERGSGRR